jgi:hypothetical protein
MSTVSWLIPPSHLVVVSLQVASITVSCRTRSVQDVLYLQCPRKGPSIRAPGPHQRFYDQEWRQPGCPVSQEKRSTPKQTGQTLLENWRASPTHIPAKIACFRYILQQIVIPTRGRPTHYESSSSGLPQRTKPFFRSMTLALQCVPDAGRTAWTSAGTTRMSSPS